MAKQKTPEIDTDHAALVPAGPISQPASAGILAGLIRLPEWGTPLHLCPTSLDLSTRGGYCAAFNAVGAPTIELDKNGCAIIDCAAWLIHPMEVENEESGEVSRVPRLVLIDSNGQTFATTSQVVMERLAQLVAYFGQDGWQTVRLEVVETKKKRGMGTYHNLRVHYREGE